MKAATKVAGNIVLAVLGVAGSALFQPAAAQAATAQAATAQTAAATPALPSLVAYVRSGNVYVSKGATETRLTTDGGYSRPRWSPDGKQLAYLKGGQLWVMKADGSTKRRLTTRPASGPSWSPDSRSIAFASTSCTGGPGVFRIAAGVTDGKATPLFPQECRTQAAPAETAASTTGATGSALTDQLKNDDAVAWSPDGTKVAFRGGACEDVYDSCLSIGTVTTGAEQTVAAYGGGSLENSGFAVVPNWRSDGAKLSWTAAQTGETTADDQPVHVVEYDTISGAERTVGASLDRELAYVDGTRGVVTGQYQGGSWVLVENLASGTRTAFHTGSQPSVQPVK
jgi:Tol biopolymer transport system component